MSGFGDRLRGWLGGSEPRRRERGRPPSPNGASSLHAHWVGVPADTVACEVDLTVVVRPNGPHLHFWALQASFVDRGRVLGAGHLGLQHYPLHPGDSAVNWGGYHQRGGELTGTASALPSAPGNVNTRDYPWQEGTTYRLHIGRGDDGWLGSVTDLGDGRTTVVRELHAPSSDLGHLVVWSEVFAPCEGPQAAVRWSRPLAITRDGTEVGVNTVSLTYQTHADGGCSNTTSRVVDGTLEQRTATPRLHPHGAVLDLGADRDGFRGTGP